ncbi:MAG: serine/threonine-protein kinase [Polyangia bacterium]|nr:serine/threonine-protein kinase [Polyangia bacterium]
MSKLPPLPPIPGVGSSGRRDGGQGKGGNGRSESVELITDADLLELVEADEPAEKAAARPPGTGPAAPAAKTKGSHSGPVPRPGGPRRLSSGETTPVREGPDLAEVARAADALGKGVQAPVLSPLDDGKKSRSDEPEVQKLPLEGRRFGRFELLLQMGQGGMATLFLARIRGPQNFEKLIAIKKIHDHLSKEDEFVDMFLDEARISALIHHPNVVQIFDLGSIDGAYFIAMEYVHGQDLSQVLRGAIRSHSQTFGWPYAARLVADAAAGLHAAHELTDAEGKHLGLVHRDVSPQNILVSYDGHVKVVDFGIAYAAEKISQTSTGTLKGKAAYMSPEQSRGQKVDRRSDVFALGILLFESVCLKRLFREDSEAATLLRVGAADVPRPRSIRPDLPAELEKIILKSLAKDPANRFSSAQELQVALEQLLVTKGEMVGPAQVAQLMTELFHDRKRIRDQQIRDVAARPSDEVNSAIGMSTTTVTQLGSLDEAETGPPRRWVMPVVISAVVIAVLALVAVIGLPLLRGGKDKPGSPPPKVEAKAPPPPDARVAVRLAPPPEPMAEKVIVEIKVLPKDAKAMILFRGKEYRQTELDLLVEPSDAPEVVRVEAPGYQGESRHITVNDKVSLKHEFQLKKVFIPGMTTPRPMTGGDDLKFLPTD